MGKKRKRTNKDKNVNATQKRAKTENAKVQEQKHAVCKNDKIPQTDFVEHPVLSRYFPSILTLRSYLLHLLATDTPEDKDLHRRYLRLKHFSGGHDPEGVEVNDLLDYVVVGLPKLPTLKILQEKEFPPSHHDDIFTRSSEVQRSSQNDVCHQSVWSSSVFLVLTD